MATGKTVKDTNSIRHTFLNEELIEYSGDNNELFVKFINNASAVTVCSIGPDSVHYPVAIFLCFMQHIQYEKSKGLVFLSDLQGLLMCLSNLRS
ncbi:unnamed protein product [Mycena citricolor]|uniref:Alpha-type protein kinase domain-containing protein n=1 Tax=Mycena citricolor TaxID=2018698 RepID=A0AAD2HAC6_9AGAR|nr:unnamed protein product [Mycena citricolor]